LRSLLEFRSFFGDNRPFYRANLDTDAAINTSGKINPIPIGPLNIFSRTLMNAGDGTGIDTIGDAFAGVGYYGMWHSVPSLTA
jgi:hypothetical protein